MTGQLVFPWECRDKEDQAWIAYNNPLRRTNQILVEENMRLKRILRENGISWSPLAQTHLNQNDPTRRKTRSSIAAAGPSESTSPFLPTEVLLRILKFAMKSKYPIIDPLSAVTVENLTDEEKKRGNQIAIHFLATCKAMHAEGTRFLWESNHFIFTTPQALRNFSELSFHYRHKILHINMRVIARYYDDQRRRHKLEKYYHPDLKKDQPLKIHMRPKESPLVRGGFRCYTWNQVIDFLLALRAPFDPTYKDKKNPRPRLLPSLSSLRLDLVNFSDSLLPFSGSELHEVASHELGCTLNELQVTGMPFDDVGMKASAELSGLVKDEGLYLDASAAFIAHPRGLQSLSGDNWCARVIRAYKDLKEEMEEEGLGLSGEDDDENEQFHLHSFEGYHKIGTLPAAPSEEGHPPSTRDEKRVIWKKVPVTRESDKRMWIQFSRTNGYEIEDSVWDSDDDRICPCCGDSHPGSSILGFMSDDYE
ncbi:hypothetical protein N5P37_003758 [Trichoderma harzianum]|uniref:Uncharacterized protein n=2 Tax=Trichoderma TaxID=5543 RepID=A0A2T4AVH4_TRIHA|nr:hypothetical protein M431DRAFT_1008 [Trichoderma harzianum CBS 226.95]KAF3072292.1 hypothetical protein CFAM422_005383 [Trichoderma lentiforme]KAK0764359.1 hypothetical protein N5P37_003758 [Trichoderma harzianum]PTB61060.1 hypothetical protein M431DRAFT_1008 [Trichoderma harzianum CBS 226.95]